MKLRKKRGVCDPIKVRSVGIVSNEFSFLTVPMATPNLGYPLIIHCQFKDSDSSSPYLSAPLLSLLSLFPKPNPFYKLHHTILQIIKI